MSGRAILKRLLPSQLRAALTTARAAHGSGMLIFWMSSRGNARQVLRLGSAYGGWVVPADRFNERSVCYCAGCGEDITFDLALIAQFGCPVYGIDPTPRAIDFVQAETADEPRYRLLPIGLWSANETVRFYAPQDDKHVSHSITNMQLTEKYFEAEVRTLAAVMAEHGHTELSLLKLDIEGAELEVLESVLDDSIDIDVLCVEFDCLTDRSPAMRTRLRALLERLRRAGYQLFWLEGRNFTFTKVRPA